MNRLSILVAFFFLTPLWAEDSGKVLSGTRPLTLQGDIASQLVEGVDRFLLREIEAAAGNREKFYQRDLSSPDAYTRSLQPNRQRLAHILGIRDARKPFQAPELIGTLDAPTRIGQGTHFAIHAVRWPVIGDVQAEGLLLVPTRGKPAAHVIAIPDADITPEQLVGLLPGLPPAAQYARRLAQSNCQVLIPTLIDRTYAARNGRAKMTSREFLYRSAFELGRHLIGYEVQQILAGVDWFSRSAGERAKIGVFGWGEGGLLALYAAALDPRIGSVCVSGYFTNRNRLWQEPIDRNVFGLLEQFGDAELAAMVAPARLVVEACRGPELTLPSEGGAPAQLKSPPVPEVKAEFARIGKLVGLAPWAVRTLVEAPERPPGSDRALREFLLGLELPLVEDRGPVEVLRKDLDTKGRQQRLFHAIDRHNQQLLEESPYVRNQFLPIADQQYKPGSHPRLNLTNRATFEQSIEHYRAFFANEIIGRFDHQMLPANPRTRLFQESSKWRIYQVVLDVFPDVMAYGLLILPRDLRPGERRPVVVCQHGLEGRPEDTIGKQGYDAYKAFATGLVERGFITFAPQNLYIFRDRFRTLQRKANPIKKTLFSVIVPQHQQITDWLKTLPMVDGERIAFYGLSYGGKTAMRVPPLVKNYCLSICSADFNDWVWKNASSRSPYSYVWTMEYEIFEFDLGNTFNYAEMAALIAPRPFMVERGHFDGVAPDERVALEFAKVRHLYQAKLGLGDRATIEWFVGPHTIYGKGTYAFLHHHLNWPVPGEKR